jgi:subtilisin family serine protease
LLFLHQHDITVGTSFATPVVSGVAALMLQVNPELGWRDVQGIMQQTAALVDFTDSSWVTNGAGISHSYKYGENRKSPETAFSLIAGA